MIVMQDIKQPRVIDNGRGAVLVVLDGRQVRGWSYQSDAERRIRWASRVSMSKAGWTGRSTTRR